MTRLEATRVIIDHAGDAAIIASLGHPAYDLFAAGDRPHNFYTCGRTLAAYANGARGYHDLPASDDELATKFLSCATQAMPEAQAAEALASLRAIESAVDVRAVPLGH